MFELPSWTSSLVGGLKVRQIKGEDSNKQLRGRETEFLRQQQHHAICGFKLNRAQDSSKGSKLGCRKHVTIVTIAHNNESINDLAYQRA